MPLPFDLHINILAFSDIVALSFDVCLPLPDIHKRIVFAGR